MTKNALIRGQNIATSLRERMRVIQVAKGLHPNTPEFKGLRARLDVIRHAVECEAGHDLKYAFDGNHTCPCDDPIWRSQWR